MCCSPSDPRQLRTDSISALIGRTLFSVTRCVLLLWSPVMEGVGEETQRWIELVSRRMNEPIGGTVPPAEERKKKAMLLNQIFSLCSVCRHNGCFSLEKLTGWHFLLWDGPVQIRGNWFNGSALMAQKATSSVDTFLFSLFFPFFFCLLPALALFFPSLSGLHLIFFIFCAARIVKDAGVFVASVDAFAGDSLADGSWDQ